MTMGDEDDQVAYWPRFLSKWSDWCDEMDDRWGLLVALTFGWPLFIIEPICKAVLYVMNKVKKRRMRRRELRQRKAHDKAVEVHRQRSNPLRTIKRNLQV